MPKKKKSVIIDRQRRRPGQLWKEYRVIECGPIPRRNDLYGPLWLQREKKTYIFQVEIATAKKNPLLSGFAYRWAVPRETMLMQNWPRVLSRILKFRRPSISHLTFKICHIAHPVTILSVVCIPPNLCWTGVPLEERAWRWGSKALMTNSWQATHAHALFWYHLLGEVSSEWLDRNGNFVKLLDLTSSQALRYLL